MTYIKKDIRNFSPFDIGKISGTTNPTFNTFNVDWLSTSGNNIVCENGNFYSEAVFSPNSNTYGLARIHYDGNSIDYHLMGSNFPESSNSGAGAWCKSDDVAMHIGSSHYPKYQNYLALSLNQDVSRANLKIIRTTMS